MTIPSFHFDVEEIDGRFHAVCTEFEGIAATGASREEAIAALMDKLTDRANHRAADGGTLPESLYTHHRPL